MGRSRESRASTLAVVRVSERVFCASTLLRTETTGRSQSRRPHNVKPREIASVFTTRRVPVVSVFTTRGIPV